MKTVCVYCGSSPGLGDAYLAGARALGEELLQRKIGLVYGGARVGLMGELANTVLNGGGEVTGVLPKQLFRREVPHQGLNELIEVESMHERKALMAELADGFIALPGGLGTLEELFEILTWSQLQLHNKPCGILDINAYYKQLMSFIDHAVGQQFIREQHREMTLYGESAAELLDQFENYVPSQTSKWAQLEE